MLVSYDILDEYANDQEFEYYPFLMNGETWYWIDPDFCVAEDESFQSSIYNDPEPTVCGYTPEMDYNCMFNVLEIAEFKSNGCIATATLLLHSGKNVEKIGTIWSKQFSEPVSHVEAWTKFGNIDEVIEREHNWSAMIEAVYKIDGIRFESVIFGNSIVPFFAMNHNHLSYLMTDKEVEALSKVK